MSTSRRGGGERDSYPSLGAEFCQTEEEVDQSKEAKFARVRVRVRVGSVRRSEAGGDDEDAVRCGVQNI
jgi:hypothetical protein